MYTQPVYNIDKSKKSFFYIINYYKKKVNINNIIKFFHLLRNKNFKKLYSFIKTPKIAENSLNNYIDIINWTKNNVVSETNLDSFLYNAIIDIIVPIFNGYEYLDALFNSIPDTRLNYRLFIVNDCSTDNRISGYLGNLAKNDNRITLITNNKNIGYVKSVNKAFSFTSNHVALLNSDIELPAFWLERLMYPILYGNNISSSTPFTNCGTICSFPEYCKDNPLFEQLTCNEIDTGFQKIKPSYTTIPTGVGFCMGVNKNVLDLIGIFDEESFSKGYGEENDWCQRAIKAGFTNVLVENLFVYHKHGGSFSYEEKNALNKYNFKLLIQKHPDYLQNVNNFINRDPVKNIRNFVIMYLLNIFKYNKLSLFFDHNIGGGANYFSDNFIKKLIETNNSVIKIHYNIDYNVYQFNFYCNKYIFTYNIIKIEDLHIFLDHIQCQVIYINELVTYPYLKLFLDYLLFLKNKYNTKLIFFVHDYFCICPTTTLLNDKKQYCYLPDINKCEICFNNISNNKDFLSIFDWRKSWEVFFNTCDEIIIFSNNSKEILLKYYYINNKIKIKPHTVDYITNIDKKNKTTNKINIGLIGMLGYHKGLSVIKEMLDIIKNNKMNINIILIGSSENQIKSHPNYSETGKYKRIELPLLTLKNDIDIFFIASIWPETFSYTTEEVIKMDMPVSSFNIGAPAERISVYKKGLIISKIDAETALYQIIEFYNTKIKKNDF